MADVKIQDLKRSISSWSLSTFKKPKIINPLFKNRKVSLFSGKSRESDTSTEFADASANVPKGENTDSNELEFQASTNLDNQNNPNKSSSDAELKDFPTTSDEPLHSSLEQEYQNSTYVVHDQERLSSPPVNDPQSLLDGQDISFIDDAEESDVVGDQIQDAVKDESDYQSYYYKWFDASSNNYGSSYPSSYYESKFYDAQGPAEGNFVVPTGDSYEDVNPNMKNLGMETQEFGVDSDKDTQLEEKSCKLIRSSSEIQIQDGEKKKSKKYEIILNSKKASSSHNKVFSKLLRKGGATSSKNTTDKAQRLETQEKQNIIRDQALAARKESIKKIFGIKGKLSVKPIIDANEKNYKETDIYIASTPYALANSNSCKVEEGLDSAESSDNCDDGIVSTSIESGAEFDNEIVPKSQITELIDENNREAESPLTEEPRAAKKGLTESMDNIEPSSGNKSTDETLSEKITKIDITPIETDVPNGLASNKSLSQDELVNHNKGFDPNSELQALGDSSDRELAIDPHSSTEIHKEKKLLAETEDLHSEAEQKDDKLTSGTNCEKDGTELNLEDTISDIKLDDHAGDKGKSEKTEGSLNNTNESKSTENESKSKPFLKFALKKDSMNKSFDKTESDVDVDPLEIEDFKAEINKRANASSYISRTFKSIKENIFPSEYYREKVNRKKKMRLNPFSRRSRSKKSIEPQNQVNVVNMDPSYIQCSNQVAIDPCQGNLNLCNSRDFDTPQGNMEFDQYSDSDRSSIEQTYKPHFVEARFTNGTRFPEYENWKMQNGNEDIDYSPNTSEEDVHSDQTEPSIEESGNLDAKEMSTNGNRLIEHRDMASIHLPDKDQEIQLSNDCCYSKLQRKEKKQVENGDVDDNIKSEKFLENDLQLNSEELSENLDCDVGKECDGKENNISLDQAKPETILTSEHSNSPSPTMESQTTSTSNDFLENSENPLENSFQCENTQSEDVYPHIESVSENASSCLNGSRSEENALNPASNCSEENPIDQNVSSCQTYPPEVPQCPPKKRCAPPKPVRKGKKTTHDLKNWKNFSQPNIHLTSNEKNPSEEHSENMKNNPSAEKDPSHSRDSGYGTSNNESSSPGEPIYWEINEPRTLPKPSPRRKKEKPDLPGLRPASVSINRSFSSSFTTSLDVPEWIQQRPPIPSPRSKKQNSTLSLNTEATHYPGSYHSQFNLGPSAWSGEEFYSGKAASISYGVTSHSEFPPNLPIRTKKPSLVSLPGDSLGAEAPKEPHELVQRRRRRRTAPVPPSPPALRHQVRPFIQSEELLKDVLFSVVTAMGADRRSSWGVSPPGTEDGQGGHPSSSPRQVSFDQVVSHLQDVFLVTSHKLEECLQEAKNKQIPDIFLNLRIEEGSELRPKTVRGGTNPYVCVRLSSCPHTFRTRSERETLFPKWQQDFKIKLSDLRKDILTLEVIHEYDHVGREDLKEVHDLGGVSRLISMTNAKALKQETKLLGKATVPVCDIVEKGFDSWVALQKDGPKDEVKPRGSLHLKAYIGADVAEASQNETRKKFDSLLTNLVHHAINFSKKKNEEANMDLPYRGQLSPEALALLSQYAIIHNISNPAQSLSWWLVGSHVPTVDMDWQLTLLKKVQSHLSLGYYNKEETEVLADSFASWSRLCVHKLRNLQTSFPASSGVIARHQLTSLLQTANCLEDHSITKKLLLQRGLSDLRGKIKETVLEHVEIWWKSLTNFRGSVDLGSQMKKMISFFIETEVFFKIVSSFYSPVFLKESKIAFFREVFIMISKGIRECVLPLLQNIDLKYAGSLESHREESLDFSVGPDLWQIYVNLRRIYSLGADLPPEVLGQSGLFQYHKWFEKGVLRWIELSKRKTHSMLCKAVEFDVFQPDDEYHNFSSSASDTIGIFNEVQIWWKRLEWPDEVNSGVFFAKILQDVCSCGTAYSELIKAKVDATYNGRSRLQEDHIISEQTCIGLNNIEKVRLELTFLPDTFGVNELAQKIEASPTGGTSAAQTFRNNIREVIEDSSSNMERKVTEFIDTVIEKRKDRLRILVGRSFDEGHEGPLLNEVLDPSLQLLQQKLDKRNFKRLLSRLWDELVQTFEVVVARNSEDKRSSYFEVVCNIIEVTLKFFTPSNGVGLEREEAKTQRYLDLMEHLELRRLPSEKLIEKYYHERFLEHSQPFNQQKAELVIKAYFTRIGKLKVDIIMAKDMILSSSEGGSISSKQSNLGSSSHPVDSYVKIQLVPSVWFRDNAERKTKVSWKSDPAVYDQEFEFELSNTDNGVSNGFLLLTLKDKNLARGNTFIGEAVLPLRDLQCVDSADVGTVSLSRLKMTSPGLEIGYKSLAMLRLRTSDSVAKTFVKKVTKRIPDSGRKSGFLTASSDEEKPKTRSPGGLPRRKIS